MGNRKLVYSCIIGIVLGYVVPLILKTDPHTSLMVGLIGGLAVGYLLESRDDRNSGEEDRQIINEKAERANKLMERARRGVENEYLRMEYDDGGLADEDTTVEQPADEDISSEDPDELSPVTGEDEELDEQAQKLNEAEELLRAARERMK